MSQTLESALPSGVRPMEISQICVVVRDIRQSMQAYVDNCGWGPWKVFEYDQPLLHHTEVGGAPVEYTMIGAETTVGSIGFELIQPVSGPSIYQKFLDENGEGVQHIACMMHTDEDSSAFKKYWADRGVDILMSGHIGSTIEFYYLNTGALLKFVLESGSGHAIDLQPTYVFP